MDPHSSLISLNLDIFIAKQLVYKLRFNYVLLQTLLNKFENFEEKGNENHLEPFFIPGWHMLAAAYWYGFDGEIF